MVLRGRTRDPRLLKEGDGDVLEGHGALRHPRCGREENGRMNLTPREKDKLLISMRRWWRAAGWSAV